MLVYGIQELAKMLGVEVAAIKRRLIRGSLIGKKNSDGEWDGVLMREEEYEHLQQRAAQHGRGPRALHDLDHIVVPPALAEDIHHIAKELTVLREEVTMLRGMLATRDEQINSLIETIAVLARRPSRDG